MSGFVRSSITGNPRFSEVVCGGAILAKILGFIGFCIGEITSFPKRRAIQFQPVRQSHGHKPRFPVAPVEHGGSAVLEAFSVPDGLSHCMGYVQALRPLALNVNAWQAGNIRNCPITLSASRLYVVPGFPEEPGKLQLSSPSFLLLRSSHSSSPRKRPEFVQCVASLPFKIRFVEI